MWGGGGGEVGRGWEEGLSSDHMGGYVNSA